MAKIIDFLIIVTLVLIAVTLININYNLKQEDLNHDGVVNSADLLYLKKYLLQEVME